MMFLPRTGTRLPTCETQFSAMRLRHRQLVVAAEDELLVDDLVDRVGAPAQLVGRAAASAVAAAPLVREQDGLAVVGERGAVPVGEQRVGDRVDALRVGRVGDVDQEAVALAGAGGQVDLLVDRDVVAGVGDRARRPRRAARGSRCPRRRRPAIADAHGCFGRLRRVLQAVDAAGVRVGEQARLVHDGRGARVGERDLDDLDPPERRSSARSAGLLPLQPASSVDATDAWTCPRRRCRRCSGRSSAQQRVRVRAAARLHAVALDARGFGCPRCRRCGCRGSASRGSPAPPPSKRCSRAWRCADSTDTNSRLP